MNRLFAVPFDSYISEFTNEGIIYNIIDSNNVVKVQYLVTHRQYTLHDLLIETNSGAPNSMRRALNDYLDNIYGKDQWKIVTVFSPSMVRKLDTFRQVYFDRNSIKLSYDNTHKQVVTSTANQNAQKGF